MKSGGGAATRLAALRAPLSTTFKTGSPLTPFRPGQCQVEKFRRIVKNDYTDLSPAFNKLFVFFDLIIISFRH